MNLDEEHSVVNLDFGSSSATKSLILVFKVDVCRLGPEYARRIAIDYRFSDLDDSAFGDRDVVGAETDVVWTIPVSPKAFPPGDHAGQVVIGGKTIVGPTSVNVTMSRSESPLWALGLATLATLIGVLAAYFGAASVKKKWLLVTAMLIALVPVGAIVQKQYFDVEGWAGDGAKLALFLAALAAAYGAAKAVVLDRSSEGRQARRRRRGTTSQTSGEVTTPP